MFHNLREFGLKPDAAAYHIMCQAYVTAGDVRQVCKDHGLGLVPAKT